MFDGLEYTRQALAEELSLTERHARDGSAVDGGCACIEEKHLLTIAGLASEGVTLAKDQAEINFYQDLARWARDKRKSIVYADWKIKDNHTVSCSQKIQDCIIKTGNAEECRKKIKC